ncbi:MAG: serine hydrolase domain-containing protein [Alphaproteobacteria bacterium]
MKTVPNPDLAVTDDLKPRWNSPDHRRHGFHNLYRLSRHAVSLRATNVLCLEKCIDRHIGERDDVRRMTSTTMFSAMAVVRGDKVLFEKYASDFGPHQPHSIQSITKTHINLVYGGLTEQGLIDLDKTVGDYLPEIGSGYRNATVQAVLNMDVENDYSEDYDDPLASSYRHEVPMGWRLPPEGLPDVSEHDFLASISSEDVTNRLSHAQYKSANTDVLGWIAEKVSGRPLRHYFADITEAAGLEGCFHITTDRDARPWASGGGCLTARDLARYGLLFTRGGKGIDGQQVGSAGFIERTLKHPGKPMPAPRENVRYSNQMFTGGRWVGHGGYGGQFMLCDLESGVVSVFFSVLENRDCYDPDYSGEIINMLAGIAEDI